MRLATISWSDAERAALNQALREYMFIFDGIDDVGVHASLGEACIRRCAGQSPLSLSALELLSSNMHDHCVVLKNIFDCSTIPPTPTDDRMPPTAGWYHVIACILGALSVAGTRPGSFFHEKEGRLCHMVAPARVSNEALHRTTKTLHYHTEIVNGALPGETSTSVGKTVSPDIIALACLRNPHSVGTTVLPVERILESLPFAVIQQLLLPVFSASSQSSFDIVTNIANIPVLVALENGQMAMRYSRSKLAGNTADAQNALRILTEFLDKDEFGQSISLHPGDVLLMNNRTCLHRRVAIKDTACFDGTDRWLIRVYGFQHDVWRTAKRSSERHYVIIPSSK